MGKGQIISGGTDGLYNVKLVYNRDRLAEMLAELATKKTAAEEKRAPIQADRNDLAGDVNEARAELVTITQELADNYDQLSTWQSQLSNLNMEITELESDLSDAQDDNAITWESIQAIQLAQPETYEEDEEWQLLYDTWTVGESNIDSLENQIDAKKLERDDLNNAIGDLNTTIDEQNTEYEEKLKVATELAYDLALLDQQLSAIDIDIAAIDKRVTFLNSECPEDETVSVWCADLTEDLSGHVGTVEVPGEKQVVQIQPGYEGNAAYNETRDGQLFFTPAMTPAQTFYNYALLPGWQKWKPIFRYGTITDITDGLASVTFDASIVSTAQDLDINQSATLTGVDFEYMSCDDSAFAEGDEVLIKFENQLFANPKIVGFKEEPQPCELVVPYIRANAAVSDTPGYLLCNGGAVALASFADITEMKLNVAPHTVITPYGGVYPAPYEYDGQLLEYQVRNYEDESGTIYDEIPWMSGSGWDPYFHDDYATWHDNPKPYRLDYRTTYKIREGEYYPEYNAYESGGVLDIYPDGETLEIWTRHTWSTDYDNPEAWQHEVVNVIGDRIYALDQADPTKYAAIYGAYDWHAYDTELFPGEDMVVTRRQVIFKGLGHTELIDAFNSTVYGSMRMYKINGKYVATFFIRTWESGAYKYQIGTAVEGGSFTLLDVTYGMFVNGSNTDILTNHTGGISMSGVGLILVGAEYDRS